MTPKKPPPRPRAPVHLKAGTRKWWSAVVADYLLDDHHVHLLTLAAEAWDRCAEARERVAKDGPYVHDRFGQLRSHPALAVERDSRTAYARLLRELDLDVEPPRSSSRPPSRY